MSVVAVIGLGYVGLPLVVEFAKHVKTIGFDIALLVFHSEAIKVLFLGFTKCAPWCAAISRTLAVRRQSWWS